MRLPLLPATVLAAVLLLQAGSWAQPDLVFRVDGEVAANLSTLLMQAEPGETDSVIVTVRNQGSEDLVFADSPPLTTTSTTPDVFSVIQPALEQGNKLSPNGSTAFRVDFEPDAGGVYTLNVLIPTNQQAEPFRLNFEGRAPSPQLVVRIDGEIVPNTHSVSLGILGPGDVADVVPVLRNQGAADLLFLQEPPLATVIEPDGAVETTQPALEAGGLLSPNGSTAYRLRFAPTSPGPIRAEATIATNDAQSPNTLVAAAIAVDASGHLDFCGSMEDIAAELALFRQDFGVDADVNLDGLPDELSLRLAAHEICNAPDSALSQAVLSAYEENLLEVLLESDYDSIADYRSGLAALMLLDDDAIDELRALLTQANVQLDGLYLPAVQAADSILAASDYDGDGVSNAQERQNVIAAGGDADDFIEAAVDPQSDGTPPPPPAGFGCAQNGAQQAAAFPVEMVALVVVFSAAAAVRHKRKPSRAAVRRPGTMEQRRR